MRSTAKLQGSLACVSALRHQPLDITYVELVHQAAAAHRSIDRARRTIGRDVDDRMAWTVSLILGPTVIQQSSV